MCFHNGKKYTVITLKYWDRQACEKHCRTDQTPDSVVSEMGLTVCSLFSNILDKSTEHVVEWTASNFKSFVVSTVITLSNGTNRPLKTA